MLVTGVGGWHPTRTGLAALPSRRSRRPGGLLDPGGRGVDPKEEGALLERAEASFAEIEELRPLLAEARERGYVTFDELAGSLEEVDVTKEQLRDLRAYLVEQGIELLAQDGTPARLRGEGEPEDGDGAARESGG